MPGLPAGVIFEHRDYNRNIPNCGNIAYGVLVLAWRNNGLCQADWAGESFQLPGQLQNDREWFEPMEPTKQDLLREIDILKKKVESLA